ncbi:MAG: hypothetical protein EOM88_00295 [Clostridia bacterium]|nr:hypothetical protein [Clostridia bacterium]
MGRVIKTIEQKLQTKLRKISDANIKVTKKQVRVGNNILFKYSSDEVSYTKTRYFPRLKDEKVMKNINVKLVFYRTLFSQSAASVTMGSLSAFLSNNKINNDFVLLEKTIFIV